MNVDKPPRKSGLGARHAAAKTKGSKSDGQASSVASEERAKKRGARMLLQRAARRPRAATKNELADDAGGRLFVTALARGLEVLSAFRAGCPALGDPAPPERKELPTTTST